SCPLWKNGVICTGTKLFKGLSNCQMFCGLSFCGGLVALHITCVFQLYAGRAFYHKTSYEELNFKFTIFLSYEARTPCLRIGDVMRSAFIFSSFSLICQAKLLNLPLYNYKRIS